MVVVVKWISSQKNLPVVSQDSMEFLKLTYTKLLDRHNP
jgi:hypothetical protein